MCYIWLDPTLLYQRLTQLSNFVGVRVVIVKHPYHVMRFYLLSSQDNHKRTSPLVFVGKIKSGPWRSRTILKGDTEVSWNQQGKNTVNYLRLAFVTWAGLVELQRMIGEAESICHPSDRGGVSSTIYILVHLLGHLLCMATVGRGHGDSAEGGKGQG